MERVGLTPSFFKPTIADENGRVTTPHQAQQDFSKMLKDAINQVNEAQVNSDVKTQQLINNEINDLHEVMIASEKASVMMQVTIEVRNKAVEAYQEIMRMPL